VRRRLLQVGAARFCDAPQSTHQARCSASSMQAAPSPALLQGREAALYESVLGNAVLGPGAQERKHLPLWGKHMEQFTPSYCLGLVPYCTSRRFSGKCDATGRRTPPPITERRYAISVRVNRYWKQLYLTRLSLPACRLGDRQFGMRINPHAPEADLSSPAPLPRSLLLGVRKRGRARANVVHRTRVRRLGSSA
jgi:hypothetical protein